MLDTAEQELTARARAASCSTNAAGGADGTAGAVVVDRVSGRLRVGEADVEHFALRGRRAKYFGRFDLVRGWSEGEATHA